MNKDKNIRKGRGHFVNFNRNIDCYQDNYISAVIMPFVNGVELFEYFAENFDDITYQDRITISYNLICAVENIHKKGYVHGDIKLENVLVNLETNEVELIDFGFTKKIGTKITDVSGTIQYIAPELIIDRPNKCATVKHDYFSLAGSIAILFGAFKVLERISSNDKIRDAATKTYDISDLLSEDNIAFARPAEDEINQIKNNIEKLCKYKPQQSDLSTLFQTPNIYNTMLASNSAGAR